MAWYDTLGTVAGGVGGFALGGPAGAALGAGLGGALGHEVGGALSGSPKDDELARLTAAANGTVPSAAEAQMRQGQDAAVRQQYALAASQPGMAPGAALRQASLGAADVNQRIAGQEAGLRAQEQATARAALQQYIEDQHRRSDAQRLNEQRYMGGLVGGAGQGAMAALGGGAGGARPGYSASLPPGAGGY